MPTWDQINMRSDIVAKFPTTIMFAKFLTSINVVIIFLVRHSGTDMSANGRVTLISRH